MTHSTPYTISEFIATIQREQGKRATTYPKIIQKKVKNSVPDTEIQEELQRQHSQISRLNTIYGILFLNLNDIDPNTASDCLSELRRERKMRKRYYPRLIYFKRITQETADEEIRVWDALVKFWEEKYLQ